MNAFSQGFAWLRQRHRRIWLLMVLAASCLPQLTRGELDEGTPELAACTEYCEAVEERCTGQSAVFESRDSCMAVCLLMDQGNDLAGIGANTLACRRTLMQQSGFDVASWCPALGPGGNDVCGSDCEALCTLRQQVCDDIEGAVAQPTDVCLSQCSALSDDPSFNFARDATGDTLQCRLVQVSSAAADREQAPTYCSYSRVIPNFTDEPCSDPDGLPVDTNCAQYCGLVMTACYEANAVYEDHEQCLQVCQVLEPGLLGDMTQNTVSCRRYQAYAALEAPTVHCTLAGPTGDGHCGTDNCNSYCRIARRACPEEFAEEFGPLDELVDLEACEDACALLDGAARNGFQGEPSRYSALYPSLGDNLECRTWHAVRALASDASECAAALGEPGSDCQ
jgi:hypothetical protein